MPVQRFRDFESAREALWGKPDDPANLRRASWLWTFSAKLHPLRIRRGVHRFRSIEDAQQDRESRKD